MRPAGLHRPGGRRGLLRHLRHGPPPRPGPDPGLRSRPSPHARSGPRPAFRSRLRPCLRPRFRAGFGFGFGPRTRPRPRSGPRPSLRCGARRLRALSRLPPLLRLRSRPRLRAGSRGGSRCRSGARRPASASGRSGGARAAVRRHRSPRPAPSGRRRGDHPHSRRSRSPDHAPARPVRSVPPGRAERRGPDVPALGVQRDRRRGHRADGVARRHPRDGLQRLDPPRDARRGARGGAARPRPRPRLGDHGDARGAGEPPLLQPVRREGGPEPGRASRPDRGVLPQLRAPVLVHAEAPAGRDDRRPVRGPRVPGARRARLGVPGPRPQRQRAVGRPQGPAGHRGRRLPRRRDRRARVPRRGRAPQHRQDLQLRAARRLRLHRDGVRRRPVAEGDPARTPQGARRRRRAAAAPGHRVRAGGAERTRLPARRRAPVLRLQAGQRHPVGGAAQAHRPRRGAPGVRRRQPDLRHPRLPGARDRLAGPVDHVRPVHGGPDAGRAELPVPRLHRAAPAQPAAPRRGSPVPAARVVLPAAAPRHAPRPRAPVPERRRDGRAAHRRPARGPVDGGRASAARAVAAVRRRAAHRRGRDRRALRPRRRPGGRRAAADPGAAAAVRRGRRAARPARARLGPGRRVPHRAHRPRPRRPGRRAERRAGPVAGGAARAGPRPDRA